MVNKKRKRRRNFIINSVSEEESQFPKWLIWIISIAYFIGIAYSGGQKLGWYKGQQVFSR